MDFITELKKTKKFIPIIILFLIIGTLIWVMIRFESDPSPVPQNQIEINDVEFKFDNPESAFQPGEREAKSLRVKNTSKEAVFYQIYFDNMEGNLKDVILFYIYQEDQLLHSIVASDFTSSNAFVFPTLVQPGETTVYNLEYKISEDAGNEYQNQNFIFDIVIKSIKNEN